MERRCCHGGLCLWQKGLGVMVFDRGNVVLVSTTSRREKGLEERKRRGEEQKLPYDIISPPDWYHRLPPHPVSWGSPALLLPSYPCHSDSKLPYLLFATGVFCSCSLHGFYYYYYRGYHSSIKKPEARVFSSQVKRRWVAGLSRP